MKTHAMDKAKASVNDCLYPFKTLLVEQGYPSAKQFKILHDIEGVGAGVKARVAFDARVRIAKVSGYAVSERRLHTLQLSSRIHLYDRWFAGLLMHSCNPNVFFDTTYLEVWTVQPLRAGTILSMDYASTEDVLFRQFACQCGELNCRGWITGSQEPLNAEGQAFMQQWRMRKSP
ncbi:SET domain-containing protein-lysine N-methyltransferase [Pseudomonas sp. ICBG1301]|uniref:SET domain-containing protein-lysine N-methyltransferase n=1 Tax=Pseudomonas sp. ICBG1301 TaxID=2795987 RepID=UPI0019664B6A|nr:SET domain-containing protein-lysine N-methyltransferase [Pseudomonas sp. ICBG1301]MBM9488784.1 SET domain-containing protein-lysine N-methyltransferase [Pseudomonas sp. ICBG1301]